MALHNETDYFSTIYIWQICFCNSDNYFQKTEKTMFAAETQHLEVLIFNNI